MKHYDRVWAEIDLDAVLFNLESIKNNINENTKIIAVIKTDGYGHGAIPIAQLLENDEKVWGYAVATSEEAFMLRDAGALKPILILGYTFSYSYEDLIDNDIRPAVFSLEMACELSQKAQKLGKNCRIHVKIDTGMSRIGIQPDDDGIVFLKKLLKLPGIEVEGIFTHFATADEDDKTKTYSQLSVFSEFIKKAEEHINYKFPLKHCSNSAGIADLPEANMDLVRAGIILYGLWPSETVKKANNIQLKPVLSLKSRIIYIKTLPENTEISYGGTFKTIKDTRVATVCIGYGDGYPRSLSNVGYVLVNGQKANILGRVCMDQMMIDITDIKGNIDIGSVVTLIGNEKDESITMEMLGDISGRFNYELACDLGKRIPRIYTNNSIVHTD